MVATESPVRPRTWFGALRAALDRPLTSYYLLLGASALLLTIGLIMVLSASSVYSYEVNDGDSYAVVRRQLVWVLIGLPLRVGRQPAAAPLDPAAGLPGLLDLAGAAAAHGVLRRRAQRQPELARRRARS